MSQIKILLIEDNPGDVRIIREFLQHTGSPSRLVFSFTITHVTHLSFGLEALHEERFDLVLLDLTLPDSIGLTALETLLYQAPYIPVIVLTGTIDDELALRALRTGAQDYLVKNYLNGQVLTRAIRYALERHVLQTEVTQVNQNEIRMREAKTLSRLAGNTKTAITAEMFGLTPLKKTLPDAFKQIVARYEELLELALEQQAYKTEEPISPELQTLAEELGFVRSGPRDLIEIHRCALVNKTRDTHPRKIQAYVEEGRLLLLELMGHLVAFYRNLSLATRYPGPNEPPAE